jgi:hypothetical protein
LNLKFKLAITCGLRPLTFHFQKAMFQQLHWFTTTDALLWQQKMGIDGDALKLWTIPQLGCNCLQLPVNQNCLWSAIVCSAPLPVQWESVFRCASCNCQTCNCQCGSTFKSTEKSWEHVTTSCDFSNFYVIFSTIKGHGSAELRLKVAGAMQVLYIGDLIAIAIGVTCKQCMSQMGLERRRPRAVLELRQCHQP